MPSLYDQWAEIYDSVYSYVQSDIPFYSNHASKLGGPVMELGCGTGRISLALAQRGIDVVGVDSSPEMLRIAQNKIPDLPANGGSVSFIEADMRNMTLTDRDVPQSYNLIILPFRTFLSLLSLADQIQTLNNIIRHIAPGGKLIFDIFVPDINMLTSEGDLPYHFRDVTDPETGLKWVLWHQSRYDNYNQIIDARVIAEQLDVNGFVSKKFYRDFQLRYIHIWEMHHLLELCGYEIIDIYGDFEFTPFDENSTEMVFVVKPKSYVTNHDSS